jgi:hypothetical protein
LVLLELPTGRFLNKTACFNTKDAGELDARRMSLAGEKLRAIQAEGLDADQDLIVVWFGHRNGLELENLRPSWFIDNCSLHHDRGVHF